jgi:hypothetical protein
LRKHYEVEEHSKRYSNGTETYEKEINSFSHMRSEEFLATLDVKKIDRRGRLSSTGYWNWQDKPNVIGPATDQRNCGTCTTLAVVGLIEGHMRIWYGINTKLSEQEVMQCVGSCNGAFASQVYDYTKNGATDGNNFKYEAKVLEQCNTNRPRVSGSKVLSHYKIPKSADAAKNAVWYLINVGPLSAVLCVLGNFQDYKSGVYNYQDMNSCG